MTAWLITWCLVSTQDPESLIEKLGDEAPAARQEAERELVRRGARARSALEKHRTADPEVRQRIERIIRKIDLLEILGESAGAAFFQAGDAESRLDVLAEHQRKAGPTILDEKAGALLADHLSFPGDAWSDRVRIADRIGLQRLRIGARLLARLLSDEAQQVRCQALVSIAQIRARELEPLVTERLKDPHENVRHYAEFAIQVFKEMDAAAEAASNLKSPEADVRLQALRRLTKLNAFEHAGAVVPLLGEDAPEFWDAAAEALARFRASHLSAEIGRFLGHARPEARIRILNLMAELGAREHWTRVAERLADAEGAVRERAAGVLARLGAVEAVEALARAAAEEKIESVRRVMNGALEVLRSMER